MKIICSQGEMSEPCKICLVRACCSLKREFTIFEAEKNKSISHIFGQGKKYAATIPASLDIPICNIVVDFYKDKEEE